MYIENIDTILNNVFDDFFKTVVSTKKFSSITHSTNFVENYETIINTLAKYLKTIDVTSIKSSINDPKNFKFITDTIATYVMYYLFVSIGYYGDKIDTFKNNMIEFSRNHDRKKLENDRFFTSESNSNVFMLVDLSKNIFTDMINTKKNAKFQKHQNVIDFFNSIGDAKVSDIDNTITKNTDVSQVGHYIIKLVILKKLYTTGDRNDLSKLLENDITASSEFIYIDVVVPIDKTIGLSDIEMMLPQDDVDMGIAKKIYDIVSKGEKMYQRHVSDSIDTKITNMFDSGFLIPVSEDFLLYHKDTERYDVKTQSTKREANKINYIIDKISTAENYFPSEKSKVSPFYKPLENRFAVTFNENEDLRILSGASKYMGNTESAEHYNELIHYRKYPYVNFKDFKRNGFSYVPNKTIQIVRSLSFGKTGIETQRKSDPIQLRVGSVEQPVNIVGVMLNASVQPLECIKVHDVENIVDNTEEFINCVSSRIMHGEKHVSVLLFDLEKEKLQTYENTGTISQMEQCKIACTNLYDAMIEMIHKKIINILGKYTELSFFDAYRIIDRVMRATMVIDAEHPMYNEIEKIIFQKIYEKYVPTYDKKDDIIYGIYGETLKLPNIQRTAERPILHIHLTRDKYTVSKIHDETIGDAICQHFVSWMNILQQKKTGSAKYIDMLYEFMQTFVTENDDFDYVCKSCGSLLDIKKYVADGEYDNATQRFIPYSIPMNVSLEDLPEYRRYNIVIRNVDGLVNRIAENINIPYLVGSSLTQKINRTTIVKDTIDLLLINNQLLRKNFKERNINAVTKYGINRELSNLFAFELDNSIFLFTPGKEKDYYKYVKHNNIVGYILFLILLELDESHISFLSGDKVCNYSAYVKFGNTMFSGLKMRTTNAGDVSNITNYPVFCYLLYVSTCILSKYPIWHHETEVIPKKVSPIKQKIMIHTIIDIINCVLEYASENGNMHIYEVILSKFNKKLSTTYSNTLILQRLHDENIKNKSKFTKDVPVETVKPIILKTDYSQSASEHIEYTKYSAAKYYPKNVEYFMPIAKQTNLTHCDTGVFHTFAPDGKTMKCTKCGVSIDKLKYSDEITIITNENIKKKYLESLFDEYCIDGRIHTYVQTVDGTKNIMKCSICDHVIGTYPQISKMRELEAIVTNPKLVIRNEIGIKHSAIASIISQKIHSGYTKDICEKSITQLVNLIQTTIGDIINIDGVSYQLSKDTFSLDHNHLGYPIEPPISFTDSDELIELKKNNPFFKRDVFVYSTKSPQKMKIIYDAMTHILLGYREHNKDYVKNTKTDNRLMMTKSIKNKLMRFGYVSDIPQQTNNTSTLVTNVMEHIKNIKNAIYKFSVYINAIKNNFTYKHAIDDTQNEQLEQMAPQKKYSSSYSDMEYLDTVQPIIDLKKYYSKLRGVLTRSDTFKLFEEYETVIDELFDLSNDNTQQNMEDSENKVMYYFIDQLVKFLEINKNKYVKQNLCQFIVEFVDKLYDNYNRDQLLFNNALQRFQCMLDSSEYFRELEGKGLGMDEYTTGIYGEYKDPNDVKTKEEIEEEEDAIEAEESMDIDNDVDAEDNYDNSSGELDIMRDPALKWLQREDMYVH